MDNSDPETGGKPMDSNYDESDLAPPTLESMLADCAAFYDANSEHIQCDGAPTAEPWQGAGVPARLAAMAGYDFWLTRCGDGAGFWDGDWPKPAATALDNAARAAGNVDLDIDDDGQIRAFGGHKLENDHGN